MPDAIKPLSQIGKRIPKADTALLATGEGKYLDDIRVPGMLFGKILRSPRPHARLLNIDVGRAEKMPGVKAVITAADTTRVKFCHLPITPNKTVLCEDRVRFIGDEIAAVAAVDEATAEEALDLIRVDYEDLPAVFNPEEAMKPGAPAVYEDGEQNIAAQFERHFGDIDRGFHEADLVFEDRFTCPPVVSCTLEPHGCIAAFDISGRLTIWASTQNPANYQKSLAGVLKMPMSKIKVITPFVGGAFGNKSAMLPLEPVTAFLAAKAQRPVKIVNTREEEFISTRTRYAMVIYLKTGVKRDGSLTARQATVITDNGAYNNKAPAITLLTCNRIGNLYRIPNVKTQAYVVYTNNQYGGALRGWGGPQAHFAVESQMDIIAQDLGMDPLALRVKNANQAGDITSWGWKITSCGLTDCLQKAATAAEWSSKKQKKGETGLGIASVLHTGGGSMGTHGSGNFEEILMKINPDGTVNVIVGHVDIGQGSGTVIAQIVAEALGILSEDVTVTLTDTDASPPTMGTWGSRVTYIGGNAAVMAAKDARVQLLTIASEMLENHDISKLEVTQGRIHVKGSPKPYVSVPDTVAYSLKHYGKPITSKALFNPPNTAPPDPDTGYGNYCPAYAFGAHIAEVEVDEETGKVTVVNYVAAHDVGRAINPMLIEGQIQGGVAMGIGYCLLEDMKREAGVTLNPSFSNYKVVNATEMPSMKEIIVESVDPNGPFGAKGVGEPTIIPAAPAIANAIFDAVGVRIRELPITPEKILMALKKRKEAP